MTNSPVIAMRDADGRLFMAGERDVSVCEFCGFSRCNAGPLCVEDYHAEAYRAVHGPNGPYLLHTHDLDETMRCRSGPILHVIGYGFDDSPVTFWTTYNSTDNRGSAA